VLSLSLHSTIQKRWEWIAEEVADYFSANFTRKDPTTKFPAVADVLAAVNKALCQGLSEVPEEVFFHLGGVSMHELVVATSLVAFLPHVQKLEMPTKTTTHKFVSHQSSVLYYLNEEHEVGWHCKDTTNLLDTGHVISRMASYGLIPYVSTSGLGYESLLDLTSFAILLCLLDQSGFLDYNRCPSIANDGSLLQSTDISRNRRISLDINGLL
jgi:hypothetical protein